MTNLALEIIYAIAEGSATKAQDTFEAAASEIMMAALDEKRAEVAKNLFKTEQVLDESVHHHDINADADDHADSHVNWGMYGKGHAQRHAGIEERIKETHGEKALKHIKKHSEAQAEYAAAEDKSKDGVSKEEYEKKHKPAIEGQMKAAQDASNEFQKSKAPRRLTRSIVRERGLREEVEQIDELSMKTLRSYSAKARPEAEAGEDVRDRKWKNRWNGVHRAADRLTKEEVEQIDELSMKTLHSYAGKAMKDRDDPQTGEKRADKRQEGLFRATDRMYDNSTYRSRQSRNKAKAAKQKE